MVFIEGFRNGLVKPKSRSTIQHRLAWKDIFLMTLLVLSENIYAVDDFVDTEFSPNLNGLVTDMVLQTNGSLLIGGDFTEVDSITRKGMARLDADGGIDTAFDPNPGTNLKSIALQDDGKILIGGFFTNVQGGGRTCCFARLNVDGTIDPSLNNNLNSVVLSIAKQSNGGLLVGLFSTSVYNGIVRIKDDDSLDPSFNPDVDTAVQAIAEQPDGKIIIGGNFETVGGVARTGIARLNSDGSLDTSFNPVVTATGFGPNIYTLLVQADGKIVIGGKIGIVNGVARSNVARLNIDGSLDMSFNPNVDSIVYKIYKQSDGKLLIGGLFDNVGGVTRNHLARVDSDGSLDTEFNPNVNGTVWAIAQDTDGKIIIGGGFSHVGGIARNRIARLEDRIIPQIDLLARDGNINEGDSGITVLDYGVRRSLNTEGVSSIDYAVIGGLQQPVTSSDFAGLLPQGTVTFSDTESSKIVSIEINGDTEIESDETFILRLFNPTNAVLGTSEMNGVIVNDDFDDDNDGIANSVDNCPATSNADQINSDDDALGDVCDSDDDNDTILDDEDNCPLVENTTQENNDDDLFGDACDLDDDNDGIEDTEDNCPLHSNVDQVDTDGDLFGNACDTDDDEDGIADEVDNCPLVENADQADQNSNGFGDVCEPESSTLCIPIKASNGGLVVICV